MSNPNPTEHDHRSRGYTDLKGAAEYTSYSADQFRVLVEQGVFPRGRPLTADGKLLWRIADLDNAIEKAWRTRRPKRAPRGIVRQRLEVKRRGSASNES